MKWFVSSLRFGIATFAVIASLSSLLTAQVTTGTILGTVQDNTGAVVSGATLTVTDTGKGTSKQLVSDENGSYNVPFLIPGTYSVAVE